MSEPLTFYADGDTAMPDGDTTNENEWSTPQPDSFFDEQQAPDPTFAEGSSEPDAGMLTEKNRSAKAKRYEKEAKGLFQTAFNMTVTNPRTSADAAAILHHGPAVSEAIGDLAADNPKVAKMIDFLTETTDNAGLALLSVTVPLALQILRNHETEVEATAVRRIRIPFRKGKFIDLKLRRIKLPNKARAFTENPHSLTVRTFEEPAVAEALRKRGIKVAYPN